MDANVDTMEGLIKVWEKVKEDSLLISKNDSGKYKKVENNKNNKPLPK